MYIAMPKTHQLCSLPLIKLNDSKADFFVFPYFYTEAHLEEPCIFFHHFCQNLGPIDRNVSPFEAFYEECSA